MNTLKTLALTAAFASFGCVNAPDEKPALEGDAPSATNAPAATTATAPASVSLWIEPGDGATHTGDTALRLGVRGVDRARGAAALRAIANGIRLETWPERAPVAATVTLDDARGEVDPAGEASATVVPAQPLADRWYVLSAASDGVALRGVEGAPLTALGGGSLGARFRVGSEPRATAVRVCDEAGVTRAWLDLSEAVADPADVGDAKHAAVTRSIALGVLAPGETSLRPTAREGVDARWLTHAPAEIDLTRATPWGRCQIVRL